MSQKKERDPTIYKLQAEICGALAHPVRLQILELLSEGEKTSTELLAELAIPKANLSQHLSVLRDAGIIHTRRKGLFQFAGLALPKIKDACAIVTKVLMEKIDKEEKSRAELRKELSARR